MPACQTNKRSKPAAQLVLGRPDEGELLIETIKRAWNGIADALEYLEALQEGYAVDPEELPRAFAHLTELVGWLESTSKRVDPWGDRTVAFFQGRREARQ